MSFVLKGVCVCGFERDCYAGGDSSGPHAESRCLYPALCRNLCGLVTVDLLQWPVTCAGCTSEDFILYDDPVLQGHGCRDGDLVAAWYSVALNRYLEIRPGRHYCPDCGRMGLVFEVA